MKQVVYFRIIGMLMMGIAVMTLTKARGDGPVPPLYAMPITLEWNPANDPSVQGYALYYGATNQPATNRVNTGSSTTATIFGLRANVGYRFYAVSYNASGLESEPSNELQFAPPAVSRLQLVKQTDGSMKLTAKAAPGTACTIQFTPTLQPAAWQTLTRTTVDQLGNILAQDIFAKQAKSRFYRVALGNLPLLGAIQIQRQMNGDMLLSGKAPPGASCRVQYASTPNATSWQTLSTVTADAEGSVATLDTTARQAVRRFYRMALP